MQSTIHTTTWLKRECSSSSFKQHTEPLMLTLKFAGAKKCIQFIALDRISNKRERESVYIVHTITACDKHNGEQEMNSTS